MPNRPILPRRPILPHPTLQILPKMGKLGANNHLYFSSNDVISRYALRDWS